jgi:hypothetical protein
MKKQLKPKDSFKIYLRKDGDKHFMKAVPVVTPNGYDPREIEITQDQFWNLKNQFITAVNDVTNETKLAYIV